MGDITNTGKLHHISVLGEPSEMRDLMQPPPVSPAVRPIKIRPGLNIVALAQIRYGNSEDWWKVLAFTPDIMYPLDLELHVGESIQIAE